MRKLELSREQKQRMVPLVQAYAREELDAELGNFDAEFLIDFFSTLLGPSFYNHGLLDARAALSKRIESIDEAIVELERSSELDR